MNTISTLGGASIRSASPSSPPGRDPGPSLAADRVDLRGPSPGAAVDLRTAMRVVEAASEPPPERVEVLWSTRATHFAFRAMISPKGTIVEAGNERRFVVHDPSGQFLTGQKVPEARWSVTPAFRPDGAFYVSHDKGLQAYSPEGELLWEREAGGGRGLAAGPEGNAYMDSPTVLRAFSPDGEPLWEHIRTYPGRGDGPLVAPDGTVITVEGDDSLRAFHPDGSDGWTYTGLRSGRYGPGALPALLSPPAMGPDGSVFLLARSGHLKQLGPDGRERWSVPVSTSKSWSAPMAVDGKGNVFLMGGPDNRELLAFDGDGRELFRRPQTGGHALAGVPGGGVAVSGSEGLLGLDLEGRARWSFSTDNKMSVSPPTFADDGSMRVGASEKVYALRIPPLTDESPVERVLAAMEREAPPAEVVQGEDWVLIGDVMLPRND